MTSQYRPIEGDYVLLKDGRIGVVGPITKMNRRNDTVFVEFRSERLTVALGEVMRAWCCTMGVQRRPTFCRSSGNFTPWSKADEAALQAAKGPVYLANNELLKIHGHHCPEFLSRKNRSKALRAIRKGLPCQASL